MRRGRLAGLRRGYDPDLSPDRGEIVWPTASAVGDWAEGF